MLHWHKRSPLPPPWRANSRRICTATLFPSFPTMHTQAHGKCVRCEPKGRGIVSLIYYNCVMQPGGQERFNGLDLDAGCPFADCIGVAALRRSDTVGFISLSASCTLILANLLTCLLLLAPDSPNATAAVADRPDSAASGPRVWLLLPPCRSYLEHHVDFAIDSMIADMRGSGIELDDRIWVCAPPAATTIPTAASTSSQLPRPTAYSFVHSCHPAVCTLMALLLYCATPFSSSSSSSSRPNRCMHTRSHQYAHNQPC